MTTNFIQSNTIQINDLCAVNTDMLAQALSILQSELSKRKDANVLYDVWHLEDIQCRRPDLSEDDCRKILLSIKRFHDASIGINWDVIDTVTDNLFPEPKNIWDLRQEYGS